MTNTIWKAAFILLMISPFSVQGQAPGYLGKRNLLGGGVFVNVRDVFVSDCDYNWRGEQRCLWENGKIGFNKTFSLSWERVASRRLVWGLYGEAYGSGGQSDFTTENGQESLVTRIFSRGLGIGTRHHPFVRKGIIAPYGSYFSTLFRLNIMSEHRYDNGKMFASENKLGSAGSLSAHLGFGTNIFLTDGLILDIGIRCGFGYTFILSSLRDYPYDFASDAQAQDGIRVYLRLFWIR